MNNFWQKLPKPFFCLAPMADVTDAPFRRLIAKYGKPDVMWTEFVSADGLVSGGREALIKDLIFTDAERPIVAQLFSSNPTKMREAAKLCAELGFDGIDINMGCPDRSIEKQGCGAAMIKTPDVAKLIIQAVKDGIDDAVAKSASRRIPVSVKTRVGYNKVEIDTWIPILLSENISALTVHARTRKEMSLVPADWKRIKEVVEIRNKMGVNTLIIGNGDVSSMDDGLKRARESGCDGVMIGRAMFGNPWFFDQKRKLAHGATFSIPILSRILPQKLVRKLSGDKKYSESNVPTEEKLRVLVEHCQLFEKLLLDVKSFAVMKKHFKAYTHGFPGAKELRVKLMETNTALEVKEIVENFLKK